MAYTKSRGRGQSFLARVWICALVLALLVFASLSSVSAHAATYASRDPQVLFLDADTGSETTNAMDLFDSAYFNAAGQTIVASGDGEKVVAPGTSSSYAFLVRNSGGAAATYKVWAEAEQEGAGAAVPLTLSLVSGSAACNGLADEGELAPGKSAVYRIAWEWPLEAGAEFDVLDTALGQRAAASEVSYRVAVHMRAEVNVADVDDAGIAAAGRTPATGDNTLCAAPIVLGVAALALIALALRKRRAGGGCR